MDNLLVKLLNTELTGKQKVVLGNYAIFNDNSEMWFEAAKNDNINIIQAFIAAGIDINQKNSDDNTALMLASRNGNDKTIKLLLKVKNIKVNWQNRRCVSALCLAIYYNNNKIIKLLRKAGAE